MMRSPILITALALVLTAAPAFAKNHKDRSCNDGKGNWHYCYVPDNDPADVDLVPIYEIISNVDTVQHGKNITVEADCSSNFFARSGSFKTDTPINGVRIPQRVMFQLSCRRFRRAWTRPTAHLLANRSRSSTAAGIRLTLRLSRPAPQ
jgi:hypothetical protein